MFNKNVVDKILKKAKNKRIKELSNNLDNLLFLDFDGVINTDLNNSTGPFNNKNLITNINTLCLKFNLKIVISSTWKKRPNFKKILYDSGLNSKIEIIGTTPNLDLGKDSEILKYLEENPYVDKFIIIDDTIINNFQKYQIKTETNIGFDNNKLKEAIILLNEQ